MNETTTAVAPDAEPVSKQSLGGLARAEKLPAKERKAIAKNAAKARWEAARKQSFSGGFISVVILVRKEHLFVTVPLHTGRQFVALVLQAVLEASKAQQ